MGSNMNIENPNFKNNKPEVSPERVEEIDKMIERFAEEEGMPVEDIISDIATFSPNCSDNPDYLEIVAEKIGIPIEEMKNYANKKYDEFFK